MSKWKDVNKEMPPMAGYQDGSTIRVLVHLRKTYWPKIYTATADYSEDGVSWYIDGYSHLDKNPIVTHWMELPELPYLP